MSIDQIGQLIGSVGFPIVMALYFAVTLNKTLKAQTEALNSLKELINQLLLRK